MNFNFNFFDAKSSKNFFKQMEEMMASIQSIIEAVNKLLALQDERFADVKQLLAEIKQLLSVGSVEESDALLIKLEAGIQSLIDVGDAIKETTAQVDAVNGEPSPAD
jgi:hypothetical protein